MEQKNKTPFYITTAITYASGKPHIGNTYEVIMTDAIARFRRLEGYDVFFLTGTDEHGRKIEERAKDAGKSPKEYVDGVAGSIRDIWNLMNTSYDHFIRTTDEGHERAVQHIFQKLYDKGDIYKNEYVGWYCVPCESFLTETQLGENHVCPDCNRPVQKTHEEAYFFKMSAYQDRLMEYIETHPHWIEPESRKNEMVNNFLKTGLQDLCVSRSSFKWGIPVTFDENHVIYVWIDALSNYITGLGYDVNNESALYKKYWPADVHIIGKDIMRFHTIYWPIILMALDLPLPKKIFGHPWFLFSNDKMSKSKGNVLYADTLAELFGVDGVRHYCLSEMPYANDGNITLENMVARYNTDLANNLGNLVSRTIAMTKKYFDGVIPSPAAPVAPDEELGACCEKTWNTVCKAMESYHVADASDALFALFRRANKYIDETAPWVLAKNEDDRARLGTVIYNLLEMIRFGASILTAFLPATADSIFTQLNSTEKELVWGSLKAGGTVGESKTLFARIDGEKLMKEYAEKQEAQASSKKTAEPEAPEGMAQIGIDDFMKVELRTAQVLACEPVKKSDRLLCLQLDLGYEKRQVVSGIAKWYTPQELIGRKLVMVANLAPVKLCGVESNGMIIASGEKTVRVLFLDDETPLGERVH